MGFRLVFWGRRLSNWQVSGGEDKMQGSAEQTDAMVSCTWEIENWGGGEVDWKVLLVGRLF